MSTDESNNTVVNRVAETFVKTTVCKEAEKAFGLLVALGRLAGGLCLLICGESGVGKSTMVKWLIRALKPTRNEHGVKRPAIYVELPTAPTAIGVFEAMLAALGDPTPTTGTRSGKKLRLLKMLREQEVNLLVLDDLQHVFDRQSERILFDASDAIKEVLILYPMSVLCAGLADAERVVKSNEQLSRRHMSTLHIRRFDWKNKKSRGEFIAVLKIFRDSMKEFDMPDFEHKSMALRVFLATGGIMDFIFKLFLFTAEIADRRKLKSINLEVLHEAWGLAFLHSEGADKPLQKTFDPEKDEDEKVIRAMSINVPPPIKSRKSRAGDRLRKIGL